MTQKSDAVDTLARFLEECSREASSAEFPRVRCDTCSGSRSIYCFECCRLFLPRESWPIPLRNGTLRLPFDVDIVLNDRRSSATGVQLQTLLLASAAAATATAAKNEALSSSTSDVQCQCRLYDVDRDETIPNYTSDGGAGTFLLFPGENSQPLSSLIDSNGKSTIKRLVVLDCKWSKSSNRFHPHVVNLPQVHLEQVPKHSYYWRWHNAGDGMLSTIEAIYYSAWQIASVRDDFSDQDRSNLVYMFWLFGLQREIIQTKYKQGKVRQYKHETGVPFSEDSKEFQRSLRAKQRLEREQAMMLQETELSGRTKNEKSHSASSFAIAVDKNHVAPVDTEDGAES